jgi:hypothetical protein
MISCEEHTSRHAKIELIRKDNPVMRDLSEDIFGKIPDTHWAQASRNDKKGQRVPTLFHHEPNKFKDCEEKVKNKSLSATPSSTLSWPAKLSRNSQSVGYGQAAL